MIGSLSELLRWRAFSAVQRLVEGRGAPALRCSAPRASAPDSAPAAWVFCSTIGELNACRPLLDRVAARFRLILITDREVYGQAYAERYPEALVAELTRGGGGLAQALAELPTPELFIVCEIPTRLSDAPCRMPYELLRSAKERGAGCYLVNGWSYGDAPSCRMDALERMLFEKDYLGLFDRIMVQTQAVREQLLGLGADGSAVVVTGNMKFDSCFTVPGRKRDQAFQKLLAQFTTGREMIVAGCLSSKGEYAKIIESFSAVRLQKPDICLLAALRHPEYGGQVEEFRGLLRHHGLSGCLRSELGAGADASRIRASVMVLDTFGELPAAYEAAHVCYVGRNHNVLEPLAFGKPVVIPGGWEPAYPSYPVYRITCNAGLVTEARTTAQLTEAFLEFLGRESRGDESALLLAALRDLSGAVDRNCKQIPELA